MSKPVILDLDTGIDDSMALALSVLDPGINLLGTICSYGNVTVENSVFNTRYMLDLFCAYHIPVFRGEGHSLTSNYFIRHTVSARIHGQDGLGDIGLPVDRSYTPDPEWEAFLLEQIEACGADLSLVTTGPLTNLATFLAHYPRQAGKIGRVISMGGALIFPGNTSECSEANISQDPEAAKIVMESGIPFVLVPLDVTEKSRITLAMTAGWKASGLPGRGELARMVEYYISQHEEKTECYVHDPSAVTFVTHPDCFSTIARYLTVETEGPYRGRVVGDKNRIRAREVNTRICLDVDDAAVGAYINKLFLRA
jgi:purine nucleosidase